MVFFFFFYQFKVLCKDSKEFSMIVQYVKNTHAETHTQYELEVLEVTACIFSCFFYSGELQLLSFECL